LLWSARMWELFLISSVKAAFKCRAYVCRRWSSVSSSLGDPRISYTNFHNLVKCVKIQIWSFSALWTNFPTEDSCILWCCVLYCSLVETDSYLSFYESTRLSIPEDSRLHTRRRENLKTNILTLLLHVLIYWHYVGHKITALLETSQWEGKKDGKCKGGARRRRVCLSMYSITENIYCSQLSSVAPCG
jgi:hypothetical protein